jgi:hypothetical protein
LTGQCCKMLLQPGKCVPHKSLQLFDSLEFLRPASDEGSRTQIATIISLMDKRYTTVKAERYLIETTQRIRGWLFLQILIGHSNEEP